VVLGGMHAAAVHLPQPLPDQRQHSSSHWEAPVGPVSHS
jgi:hypothetical protein